MRFAVISDIHGNLAALEAVFAEIDQVEGQRAAKLEETITGLAQIEVIDRMPEDERQLVERLAEKIEVVVCTGDIVGHAAHPNEVIDLLKSRNVEMIRGNYDEATAGQRVTTGADYVDRQEQAVDTAAVLWTRDNLTDANLQLLKDMRMDARLQVSRTGRQLTKVKASPTQGQEQRSGVLVGLFVGGLASSRNRMPKERKPHDVLFVHGSPRDVIEYLYPDTAISILQAIARVAKTDILIHGHTHQGYKKVAAGMVLIGVGSVGKSRLGGKAEYAIVQIAGSDVDVDFRVVDYDVEREVRDLESAGLPPELAHTLRTGSFPQAEAARL